MKLSCRSINTTGSIDSFTKCKLRSVILFLRTEGNNTAEIYHRMSREYGENFITDGAVREWCTKFKDGRTDVNNESWQIRKSVINRVTHSSVSSVYSTHSTINFCTSIPFCLKKTNTASQLAFDSWRKNLWTQTYLLTYSSALCDKLELINDISYGGGGAPSCSVQLALSSTARQTTSRWNWRLKKK